MADMFLVTGAWMHRYTHNKKATEIQCHHWIQGVRCRLKIRIGEHAARPSRMKYHGNPYWPKCITCAKMLGICQ